MICGVTTLGEMVTLKGALVQPIPPVPPPAVSVFLVATTQYDPAPTGKAGSGATLESSSPPLAAVGSPMAENVFGEMIPAPLAVMSTVGPPSVSESVMSLPAAVFTKYSVPGINPVGNPPPPTFSNTLSFTANVIAGTFNWSDPDDAVKGDASGYQLNS